MSVEVKLPELGESVTEGTVTRWLKAVGDRIEVDEPLLEVSTDKVDTEVPSPVAGYVVQLLAEEDDVVAVGATLAVIGDSADEAAASTPAAPAAPVAPATPAAPAPVASPAPTSGGSGTPVVLPELGESVTEGTVTRWLKAVGETVEVDEPLLEVSTDKVDTEVPSPVAGTVQQILVAEDDTVAVGATLAIIGDGVVAAPAAPAAPATPVAPAPATPAAAPAAPAPTTPAAAPASEEPAVPAEAYVTPIVRKLAADTGVDLATVTGTGIGGRIRREDVLAAAAPVATASAPVSAPATAAAKLEPSPLRGTTVPFSRLRKSIAGAMVNSLNTQAQLTTVVEVDITNIATLRNKKKNEFFEKSGQKLSFMSFFAYAAVELLQQFPIINASVKDDSIVYHPTENLAIAVDTERGLYAPVIKDAGSLTIAGYAAKIAEIAAKTRDNKLTPDDMTGGTFTLTNTGSRGALFDTPVVALPQSAILGTGTVVRRPAVVTVDGQEAIAVRSLVYLALSYDHRIIDGADAARYLSALKARLEAADFEDALGI